jgi:class 3 adenylate cyclase
MCGLEEGEFVKRIFKRYVTRQVAEKILSEKEFVNLKGDRREVSILFADIRGFTKFSQHMSPEEIIALLNHYFAPIIDVIIENEGVLDKFIGDGFLAFWNAPMSQKDYALRTCQAALGIQRVIARLNFQRENEGKVQIQMGMGIHTGTAIAGNIGSSRRMEYTIIGESVNFAERLQEAAMQGEILVSARTRELVGERTQGG